MSEYFDIFSFSVNSLKKLAELKIVPSQRPPSICAQVHQMEDGSYWLFWNEGLTIKDYGRKCIEFANNKGISDAEFHNMLCDNKEYMETHLDYKKYIKQLVPVKKRQLSDNDMTIVWNLVKHDFGPSGKSDTSGLDGHRYFFKIFGETVGNYETWCKVPENWEPLIPFVNLIIARTEIKHKEYYEPLNGRRAGRRNCKPIEIPSWMMEKPLT